MLNTERLCLGCMNDNGGEKVCPICGYDAEVLNPEDSLPVKFIAKNRYLIGKELYRNGAEITYIGWDNVEDSIVNIKEYFPEGFAHRNPDKTVSTEQGGEYVFNEGLMEFREINRVIRNSDLPSLIPVTDLFEENGTVYAIETAIQGISLEDFLEKNGGTLKWEQARALFLPLIDTVKGMNEEGIVHRGISTQTIIVGRDGKLRISGYSIRRLRMMASKLKAEIFSGYAAAEQYGIEGMRDAAYTDVYGLSATLFRVLIGNAPADAKQRLQSDSMTVPARFAEELPRQVLASLVNGLKVLPQNRTKDVETFKNELVYGEITVSQKRNRNEEASTSSKDKKKKKGGSGAKYAIISSLCTILVFAIIAGVLAFTVFKDEIFKPDDSVSSSDDSSFEAPVVESIGTIESGAEVTAKLYSVPELKGKYYAEIIEDGKLEMFEFEITQKVFSDLPRGTICEQSVKAGSDVVRDTKIELTISLGPKEIKIANVLGLDEVNAKLELLKQGFIYDNIEVLEKYDDAAEPGVVLDQDPKYGTPVNTDTSVKIYVNSYQGEPDIEEETDTGEIIAEQ